MIGVASSVGMAAGAMVLVMPGIATASPENINTYAPAKPSEYAAANGTQYVFAAPGGLTCVMDKSSGMYGCSGPIPAAPGGANVVTGGLRAAPGFANAGAPLYGTVTETPPRALPPNTRLSFQTVSCGTDGVTTTCLNSVNRTGFFLSPDGSFVLGG